MDLSILIKILIIVLLLIASAIFVMFEFALVKLRPTRVNELVESGNKTAKILVTMVEQLDHYLSATQLGITIVSLGLGWIGESTFHSLFNPIFELLNLNENCYSHYFISSFIWIYDTFTCRFRRISS